MAAGDLEVFNKFKSNLGDPAVDINLETDSFKLMLFDDAAVDPIATLSDPGYAAARTQDFSDGTYEVAGTGGYTTTGEDIGAVTWLPVDGSNALITWDTADVSTGWTQNGSSPADARHGVIYDDTFAGKQAVAWLDLGAIIDLSAGSLTITWGASGIFTLT